MHVDEGTLEKKDWLDLLRFIKRGKCIPIIGAGACYPYLPLGGEIAYRWSSTHGYPLKDSNDLPKVAQFMAIDHFDMFPKHVIAEEFQDKDQPDFFKEDEPHGILADLNLPIYITTNYDNFMFNALKSRKKSPERELCRWSSSLDTMLRIRQIKQVLGSSYIPSVDRPLVYHLHGYLDIPESLVLTENDYLDFMVRLYEIDNPVLPPEIVIALTTNALLFVGYSLADWNFRVLFRSIFSSLSSMTNLIIAVQLRPKDVKSEKDAIRYLGKYFGSVLAKSSNLNIRVYWGEATEFARELRKYWRGEYE
jgi:hypothetical protein